MKTYCWTGGIAPNILSFNILDGHEWSASCLATLPLGKSPWYLVDRRLGGPKSQSVHSVKEKKSLPCPCQKPNPNCPVYRLVIILTKLPLLPKTLVKFRK